MIKFLHSGMWRIYFYSDERVQKNYHSALHWYKIVSEPVFRCRDFSNMVLAMQSWVAWEQEYARRGYRTISLDDFDQCRGDYTKLPWGIKLTPGEKPIFHALKTSMEIEVSSLR